LSLGAEKGREQRALESNQLFVRGTFIFNKKNTPIRVLAAVVHFYRSLSA
jgi:hypothetical protein